MDSLVKRSSKAPLFYWTSLCLLSAPFFSFSVKDLENIEAHAIVSADSNSVTFASFKSEEAVFILDSALETKIPTNDLEASYDISLSHITSSLEAPFVKPRRLPLSKFKQLTKKNSKDSSYVSHPLSSCDQEPHYDELFLFLPSSETLLDYKLTWNVIKVAQKKSTSTIQLDLTSVLKNLDIPFDSEKCLNENIFRQKKLHALSPIITTSFLSHCTNDTPLSFLPYGASLEHIPLIRMEYCTPLLTLKHLPYLLANFISYPVNVSLELNHAWANPSDEKHRLAYKSFYPFLKNSSFQLNGVREDDVLKSPFFVNSKELAFVEDLLLKRSYASYSLVCDSEETFVYPFFKPKALSPHIPTKISSLYAAPFSFFEPPFLVSFSILADMTLLKIKTPSCCIVEPICYFNRSCLLPTKNSCSWENVPLKSEPLLITKTCENEYSIALIVESTTPLLGEHAFKESIAGKKRLRFAPILTTHSRPLCNASAVHQDFFIASCFNATLAKEPVDAFYPSFSTPHAVELVSSLDCKIELTHPSTLHYQIQLKPNALAFKKAPFSGKKTALSSELELLSLICRKDPVYQTIYRSPYSENLSFQPAEKSYNVFAPIVSGVASYSVALISSSHPSLYLSEPLYESINPLSSTKSVRLSLNFVCSSLPFCSQDELVLSHFTAAAQKEPYYLIARFEEDFVELQHTASFTDFSLCLHEKTPLLHLTATYEKISLPIQECKEPLFYYLPSLAPLANLFSKDDSISSIASVSEEFPSLDKWSKKINVLSVAHLKSSIPEITHLKNSPLLIKSSYLCHEKADLAHHGETLADSLETTESSLCCLARLLEDTKLAQQVAYQELSLPEFIFGVSYEDFKGFAPTYIPMTTHYLSLKPFPFLGLLLTGGEFLSYSKEPLTAGLSISDISYLEIANLYPASLFSLADASYEAIQYLSAQKEKGSFLAYDLVKHPGITHRPLYIHHEYHDDELAFRSAEDFYHSQLSHSACADMSYSIAAAAIVNHALRDEILPLSETLNQPTFLSYNPSEEFDIDVQIAPNNKEGGYLFTIQIEPKAKKLETHCPQNYLFLIDRSGSIDKTRFQTFKQAVSKSLSYLTEEDTFNILTFDTEITKMSHNSVYLTSSTKHGAKRFLENQKRGYQYVTPNLYELLLDIQPLIKKASLPTTVVLLTSGKTVDEFSYDDPLLKTLLKEKQSSFTLFTAGCSESTPSAALEILSTLHKGECLYSQTNAAFPRKLAALVKHSGYLAATDIHLNIANHSSQPKISLLPNPSLAPNLYGDRPYTIVGKIDKLSDFDLVLQGKFCHNYLFMKKKVSFASAKHGGHSVFKDYKTQLAHDRFHHYVEEGDICHLDEAKKLLQPITMKAFR